MTWRAALLAAAVLSASGLAACGSTVSPARAVQSWASAGSYGEGVRGLLGDAGRIDRAVGEGRGQTLVRTDCLELLGNAQGMITDLLPTPDDQLTTELSSSLDGLVHAASLCVDAPGSPSTLARVDRQLARAIGGLVASVLREEAVAGKALAVPGIP